MTEISLWMLVFATGVLLWIWLRSVIDRWTRRRRATRAVRGERAAERLLRAHGWDLIERQARQRCMLHAGDEEVHFELIADLIVDKDGRRMVAEVKTGAGRSITYAPTRRQLLEYRLAFDVDGILLVDPTTGSITPIEFHLAWDARQVA